MGLGLSSSLRAPGCYPSWARRPNHQIPFTDVSCYRICVFALQLVVPERKTRVPRDRPKKKKLGAAADANADADAPAGESVEQAVGGGKAAGAADGAIAVAGKSGPVVLGSESARKASKTQAAVLRRKAAKEAKEGAAAHPVK